jgi:hypothetical protein
MLNTGPDRSSPVRENHYYDKVPHNPLGHLLWIATPSFLTHADGRVQNFLKGLKEKFINYKQSKKERKKTYPPDIVAPTLPHNKRLINNCRQKKKHQQKKQGHVEWLLPIPTNIDDEHQKHNMKLKPAHQVSCSRQRGLSQACSCNYSWTTCQRKSLRRPST